MNKAIRTPSEDGATDIWTHRLRREIRGELLTDPYSRGRYATDASIYQIMPAGVVLPACDEDVAAAMQIARDAGLSVTARGAGTSQGGQAVGDGLMIDFSRHLNRIERIDPEARSVRVQPGVVLDRLNAALRSHGLFFPVEPSTASRCTIGGMAGNNSSGARSIVYGKMVDNVTAIDTVLADGSAMRFEQTSANLPNGDADPRGVDLIQQVRDIGIREADEIERRFPKVQRRVGGYNLDTVSTAGHNMAHLLVGSEGTLALSTGIELALAALPEYRVLGVCHFPSFRKAMESTRHLVELGPSAVELVDHNLISLGQQIPLFRNSLAKFVRGRPDALLLVEFAGDDRAALEGKLNELDDAMASLGVPGAVVRAAEPALQTEIWEVRKAGLNIMMSMKSAGKPVSFIEDCAVPLEHLAEYTAGIDEIFARRGTSGTWYAHASVGCLHVRPILDMRKSDDVKAMREMAEEAFALVRRFKGSHSGEHGDGIVRSEFHAAMFGPRLTRAFEDVKDAFDPAGRLNPGIIVRPRRMDDRALFRYGPEYRPVPMTAALDWSDWGGFAGAVEMCNNNGACRKSGAGVMCPSYRITGDERDVTRGRANTLRLAITGQLGPEALTADAMHETMALCVGCKGCKRECPTGVDMARMKIEFLHAYHRRHGVPLRSRLIAYLPRYARWASRLAPFVNLRDRVPGLARLSERLLGFSADRPLPVWRRDRFRPADASDGTAENGGKPREVVLLVDTFNTYLEPENARAAHRVLRAAGYAVRTARAGDGGRPLCCGRTFLSCGMVDEARLEARRTIEALAPFVARGVPIIGLEPSCLLTLRDEFKALVPGDATNALADHALLLEEFLAAEAHAGTLALPLSPQPGRRLLVHGHCHQKAFGVMDAMERTLGMIPHAEVTVVESSCCGMAGAFGYEAEHYEASMAMGELALLPAVRAAPRDTIIVADGTSCRQQIRNGAGRRAVHVARVLDAALAGPES